ncbi:MAG: hypothetical protein KDK29_02280 [Sedimentitalea sp.]|nr:hypothetical protein [Sedimentitalea sp.]
MTKIIKKFISNEDGAVTVDWVVLCAAVVAFSAIGVDLITENTVDLGDSAGEQIASQID